MKLNQLEFVEIFTDTVVSQTVYFNVLFPSGYRYYFEFTSSTDAPVLIDHPFRLYFPQTISIEWVPPDGENGIYLTLGSSPEFLPFGSLDIQIYIPDEVYNAIVIAMNSPINSISDLVPPPEGNTCGEVEFVLLSTDAGEQIKIDLVNTYYTPEIPVTVKTLQWREILYDVTSLLLPSLPPPPPMGLLTFEFVYTVNGILGITFIDPRYCFLREWITFPSAWTEAIKSFAGV
jgi:hypothetical protein